MLETVKADHTIGTTGVGHPQQHLPIAICESASSQKLILVDLSLRKLIPVALISAKMTIPAIGFVGENGLSLMTNAGPVVHRDKSDS